MADVISLGAWVRRFLMEHLVSERNLARNTQRSYRDTLRLLLPSLAQAIRKDIDRLAVLDLSAEQVRRFLTELEEKRGCGAATRNQRLAALHSLAHFIGQHSPEHVSWCGEIRAVPFKKAPGAPLVIWRKQNWTRCWRHQTEIRLKGDGIMPSCCSCTTRAPGPMKRPKR